MALISLKDTLRRKNTNKVERTVADSFTLSLADFTNSLAVQVERELVHLGEPTFVNPETGQRASSLDGCLRAVGFPVRFDRGSWAWVVADLEKSAGKAMFYRQPEAKGWDKQVPCVDIVAFVPFFLRQFPELGRRCLEGFPALSARRRRAKRKMPPKNRHS